MVTETKQTHEKTKVKRYKIEHSIDEYTFPKEAYIHAVKFDDKHIHVELTDGRIISIPLWWIPTVHNASDKHRNKFEINQNRTMIIWDPEKSGINDEINIADYLGPVRDTVEKTMPAYSQKESQKQLPKAKSNQEENRDSFRPRPQAGF